MSTADPILGNWYRDDQSDRQFRIVAIDDENESIEVQDLSGDIDAYDFAAWDDCAFSRIEPPEDWSAAFDGVEADDLGYSDTDSHGRDPQDMTLDDLLDGYS